MAEVELPDPEDLEEKRDKVFSRRVALLTVVDAVRVAKDLHAVPTQQLIEAL